MHALMRASLFMLVCFSPVVGFLQRSVCVCTLAAVLSLYCPRLFSNLVPFNMRSLSLPLAPLLENVSAAA